MFRLMMTFTHTSELTETLQAEIKLGNESWVIDCHRMKMGKKEMNLRKVKHHIFLPKQDWELLQELHPITGATSIFLPINETTESQPQL